MNIETTLTIISKVLKKTDRIKAIGIHEDHHEPHPFTVDDEHTAYARDTNDGILDESILEMFPCAHPKCKLAYDKHKARRTLMLQLKHDITNENAEIELIKLKPLLVKHHIAQLAFVDTEKGYKFLP